MNADKKPVEGTIKADDNTDHNAHYTKSGEVYRDEERDQTDSTEQWNAEDSRTGRNK